MTYDARRPVQDRYLLLRRVSLQEAGNKGGTDHEDYRIKAARADGFLDCYRTLYGSAAADRLAIKGEWEMGV